MQDGHPPIGWHDSICYLVLPVLLVASQFVSMEIMKPPQVNASLICCNVVIQAFSVTLVLLSAAEYRSISEEYTTYFEIPSIYDWVFLFVGAVRIVHLLVRDSSVSSMDVVRHVF